MYACATVRCKADHIRNSRRLPALRVIAAWAVAEGGSAEEHVHRAASVLDHLSQERGVRPVPGVEAIAALGVADAEPHLDGTNASVTAVVSDLFMVHLNYEIFYIYSNNCFVCDG